METEFEEQIKRLRNLVFGIGLLAILGGNTAGIYSTLFPESVQSIARDRIVTKEYLSEFIANHDIQTMVNVEHMIEDEIDQCELNHREDLKQMEEIRLRLSINEIRISECLARTQ